MLDIFKKLSQYYMGYYIITYEIWIKNFKNEFLLQILLLIPNPHGIRKAKMLGNINKNPLQYYC